MLGDDDYFQRADGVTYTPPTFLGNHDMGRVGLLLRQRSASDVTLLRRDLLAHSLLYLLRGAPVVYYGDEVGMIGAGGDKLARQDLFPTGVAAWRSEPRVGSPPIGTGSSLTVRDHPLTAHLSGSRRSGRRTRRLRPARPPCASRTGRASSSAASTRSPGTSTWLRSTPARTRATVTVTTATPEKEWEVLLGPAQSLLSSPAGRLTLSVRPLETVLVRAQAAVPVRAPCPVRRSSSAADELTNLVQARATVASLEPVSVAFALKRAGGTWRRIAADGSPPYRGFLDPRQFRRGERVHVVALARWPDGTATLSPLVAAVPRPR